MAVNGVSTENTISRLLSQEAVRKRFEDILGENAAGFISSVINVTKSNTQLAEADPKTVLASAAVAASLKLPIDPNLGFAYIIPYRNKSKLEAQFQVGYKGFIQLAMRSAQYHRINVAPIFEGEIEPQTARQRMMGELAFTDEGRTSSKILGYVAYFRLVNGFEHMEYMTLEEIETHATKFSQSYKKGNGPWKDHREQMERKTPLKTLLNRWGVLSIDMQLAMRADQSVVRDNDEFDYIDAEGTIKEDSPDLNARLEGGGNPAQDPDWEKDFAQNEPPADGKLPV